LKIFEDLLSFVEVVGGDTDLALEAIRAGFAILRMRCKAFAPANLRRISLLRAT